MPQAASVDVELVGRVRPNRPTAATGTAEAWRMWAVLAYRDTGVETWNRRRALHRELTYRAARRRSTGAL